MHSFQHRETGVAFHTNGDYSGEAIVTVPFNAGDDGINVVYLRRFQEEDGTGYFEITGIPAQALAAFGRSATVSKAIEVLENLG